MFFFRYLNHFIIFSCNLNCLKLFSFILRQFFFLRGLLTKEEILPTYMKSVHESIKFEGWKFKRYIKVNSKGEISNNSIQEHKRKLKCLVKDSYIEHSLQLLKRMNKLIYIWSFKYNLCDYYSDVWSELDIYVYKLLWNWTKRRHPRRPNTWIYNKYWRFFSGIWRFFIRNPLTGEIYILRSHYMSRQKIYRLPNSIDSFELLNRSKVENIYFNRFTKIFNGVIRVLWKKQKGKCLVCQHLLVIKNYSNLRVVKVIHEKMCLLDYVVIHDYCHLNL